MNYLVLACCAATLSASVCAQNQFGYFSLSAAEQKYDDINFVSPELKQQLAAATVTQHNSGRGFRAAAGFQFNQYFAAELGVLSPAKADFSVDSEATDTVKAKNLIGGELKASGADSRLILSYPFNNIWYLRAQLGVVWQRATLEQLHAVAPYSVVKTTRTETSTTKAIGLGYSVSRNLSLTLDIERGEVSDIEQQSVRMSVLFRFD